MRSAAGIMIMALAIGGNVQASGQPRTSANPVVVPPEAKADPSVWPAAHSPAAITDRQTEAAIDRLIARMTVEQKVGQTIQADISAITPAELARYPLGSILAGGNSGPFGNERADALARAGIAALKDEADTPAP